MLLNSKILFDVIEFSKKLRPLKWNGMLCSMHARWKLKIRSLIGWKWNGGSGARVQGSRWAVDDRETKRRSDAPRGVSPDTT